MPLESFIVEARRKVCIACDRLAACEAAEVIPLALSAHESPCPRQLHPHRLEALAARAWPADAPPASGCCDPVF